MNYLLASIVGFLNGFLALLFIVSGAIMGHTYFSYNNLNEVTGLVVGLVIGVIVAIVVCGVLAIFISMRSELMAIRRLLDKQFQ